MAQRSIYICYSQPDHEAADELVGHIEARGFQCWIAPRDVVPGAGPWAAQVVGAISAARVMVLILSGSANASPQVQREVLLAVDRGVRVVPFRVADVTPAPALANFLKGEHLLDAFPGPMEPHYAKLCTCLAAIVATPPNPPVVPPTAPRATPQPIRRPPSPPDPSADRLRPPVPLNEAELQLIERDLASYIGPIARQVLYRAVEDATTIETLLEKLGAHIDSKGKRQRFINTSRERLRLGAPDVLIDSLGPPVPLPPAPRRSTAPDVLTDHVGPSVPLSPRPPSGRRSAAPDVAIDREGAPVPKRPRRAPRRSKTNAPPAPTSPLDLVSSGKADTSEESPSEGDPRLCLGLEDAPLDRVSMTVFGPQAVRRHSTFFVQAVLHAKGADTEAMEQARILEAAAVVAQRMGIPKPVAQGADITVRLIADRRVRVDEPVQHAVWSGALLNLQFALRLPWLDLRSDYLFTVELAVDGIPVGRCKFRIRVGLPATSKEPTRSSLSRYSRVFLSYSSEDVDTVADVAQLLEVQGLDYFFDRTSLRAGVEWEQELRRQITLCDLFLLCWSATASKSKWVHQEILWALDTQRRSPEHRPDIRPFLIDGPPSPEPPPELRHLHFSSAARLTKRSAHTARSS